MQILALCTTPTYLDYAKSHFFINTVPQSSSCISTQIMFYIFQMDLGTVLNAPIKIPEYSDWKMHYVVGVRSFDLGCDLPLTLSVYSRTSTFLDWIERIVWDDEFYKD